MKTRQKALIVKTRRGRTQGLEELNRYLGRGWRVVHTTPMGGAGVGAADDIPDLCFAALVVIEQRGSSKAEVAAEVEEEVEELMDEIAEGDGSSLEVAEEFGEERKTSEEFEERGG